MLTVLWIKMNKPKGQQLNKETDKVTHLVERECRQKRYQKEIKLFNELPHKGELLFNKNTDT